MPVAASYSTTIVYETVALACLAQYSDEAFAAIFPGFVIYFNVMVLFIGTIKYLRILISRELGRGRPDRAGSLLWLGLAVAALGALVFLLLASQGQAIFAAIGHAPRLRELEIEYFEVMCLGAFFPLAVTAFEALYLAAAKPAAILIVQLACVALVIALTPTLIFGWGACPELGIAGAAWAAVIGAVFALAVYALMTTRSALTSGPSRITYAASLQRADLRALLRIGVPNGIERVFEELAWTVITLAVGRLGVFALALSNVAINILELAFLPMIALGEVVSAEVAKAASAGLSRYARAVIRHTTGAVIVYAVAWAIVIYLSDAVIRDFYFTGMADLANPEMRRTFTAYFAVLAGCIALGSLYYVMNAILTGLHDTVFPMTAMLVAFILVFCAPLYIALFVFDLGVLWAWSLFLANILVLAAVNTLRYCLHGRLRLAQA